MPFPPLDIKRISVDDDLAVVVTDIRADEWDDANEMEPYGEATLREYLSHDDNILLVAYAGDEIVGLLLATKIYQPYATGRSSWMYVDELDTRPSHRRQGIAKALMQKIFEITREMGMSEVYLGTESDNLAARRFYESLKPSETEEAIGYTFKVQ